MGSNPTSSELIFLISKINITMFFHLKVSAKDKKVLENFVKFLSKLDSSLATIKNFSQQKKRKFVTILNSPHVNKTAQEQFEFRFYSKRFLVSSLKPFSFFSLLRKVKNLSFPGIKLEIQGLFNNKGYSKNLLKSMNPDIVSLSIEENRYLLKEKIVKKKYIQLFDSYGEVFLKNSFYLSE